MTWTTIPPPGGGIWTCVLEGQHRRALRCPPALAGDLRRAGVVLARQSIGGVFRRGHGAGVGPPQCVDPAPPHSRSPVSAEYPQSVGPVGEDRLTATSGASRGPGPRHLVEHSRDGRRCPQNRPTTASSSTNVLSANPSSTKQPGPPVSARRRQNRALRRARHGRARGPQNTIRWAPLYAQRTQRDLMASPSSQPSERELHTIGVGVVVALADQSVTSS